MNQLRHYLTPPVRPPYFLWVGSGIAFVLAGAMVFKAVEMHRQTALVEARIVEAERSRVIKPVPKKTPRMLEEERQWKALQAERQFAWSRLFATIERASGKDVELLAFKPEKGNRRLQLHGEARDHAALLAFIEVLAQQPALENVHLTLQQNKKRDRLETIAFEISAGIADPAGAR